ncbi:MAG: hypothetical protein JNL42_01190 [Anaerolineae bacterium]|nr:hypothetical protein [Anaerolineae bacterium]
MGRRFGEIVIGLVLLMIGLASLEGASPVVLLLAVFGFFMLARQFAMTNQTGMGGRLAGAPPLRERRRRAAASADEETLAVKETPAEAPRVYDHAVDAARNAGIAPESAQVYPVDVGFMAFSGDDDPIVYRTSAIPTDMDYIQPYIQLHLPVRAQGKVTFEIRDAVGERIFVHEIQRELSPGDNLITPAARLPVHDELDFDGAWELRISANGIPVAVHRITWRESSSRLIRQHIQEDGEISRELKTLVEDSRLGRLSLDEMLSDQEEAEPVEVEVRQERSRRGG